MATLAESIVTSHKEAAKRATEYLQGARNLKLKPPEALELVARVLGAANWQTLLGMAKDGKAPRAAHQQEMDSAKSIAPAPSDELPTGSDLSKQDAQYVRQLAEYFAPNAHGVSEHPRLTRQAWKEAESEHDYWSWVFYVICADCGMLPWDADEFEPCRIAKAAGLFVELNENGRWTVGSQLGRAKRIPVESYYVEDERNAWMHAAEAVEAWARGHIGERWDRMPLAEKLQILERQAWPRNEEGRPMFANYRVAQEIDRENRAVCAAMNCVLDKHTAADNTAYYMAEDGKKFDASEETAAYAHQAALIGEYVCLTAGLNDAAQWNWRTEEEKVALARHHGRQGRALYAQAHPGVLRSGRANPLFLSQPNSGE